MEQVKLDYDVERKGYPYSHIQYRVKKPLVFLNGMLQLKCEHYVNNTVDKVIEPMWDVRDRDRVTIVF